MFELCTFSDEVILQPSELADFNLTVEAKIKDKLMQKVLTILFDKC